MMLNDRQILEMFERSDERALMETTAKYETYCRTLAYTIVGEEAAAKECFREALRKSWKSCPPKETKSLKTYMGRLTRSKAFRYPEEDPKVANAAEIETIVNELDDCVDSGYLGADILDENDGVVETINAFLNSLPAPKRRLFMIRYWYGMSIRAIAGRRDLPSEEVQAELSDIRADLKEAFREAKTIWPVDGKAYLVKRIGEIDDAIILGAEPEALNVTVSASKTEHGAPEDFEDEETDGGKRSIPWRNIKIVGIFAGFLAAVGLIFAVIWYMHREITIDEKHFPSEVFRAYVLNRFDLDGNGKLSKEERSEVFRIEITMEEVRNYFGYDYWDIQNKRLNVDSLKGVGYFPHLESLKCRDLDLSKLDVSANKALEYLDCRGNQLTALDVSSNKALKYLNCSDNLLTELSVRSNKGLKELDCSNNPLEKLKFRKNEVLETLYCHDTQLNELDVTPNKALKTLYCFNNAISELDLSENTALETISCAGNQLVKLDFSRNAVLKWLDCSDNGVNDLNVRENPMLKALGCNNNQLESLDLSGNAELTSLSCEGNSLTSLDIRQCESLEHLYKGNNPLTDLQMNETTFSNLVEE